jgi:hypothetical protein
MAAKMAPEAAHQRNGFWFEFKFRRLVQLSENPDGEATRLPSPRGASTSVGSV